MHPAEESECIENIRKIFYRKTGITFAHKRDYFILKIVNFMQKRAIHTCEDLKKMIQDENIFQDLIQELVVSQSYFFREEQDFSFLFHEIRYKPKVFINILSIPCAAGEEPYSLAMFLLKKGITNFSITGIDINPLAINKARRGIYSKYDVTTLPSKYRKEFFESYENGCAIKNFLKSYVKFSVKNLFDKDFLHLGRFHYIFCRNLFIYLDEKFKKRALSIFQEMLECEGCLITSFSDYIENPQGFDTIIFQDKYYYKKRCNEKSSVYS